MDHYLIERDLPGIGELSTRQLRHLARAYCHVVREVGMGIVWVQSYVVADRMYCLYLAETEQLLLEHAERGGFPVTAITRVTRVIDPSTTAVEAEEPTECLSSSQSALPHRMQPTIWRPNDEALRDRA